MNQRRLKVLIVDDEPLARKRVRSMLAAHPEMPVVAECGDGREAVRLINDLQPDVVFLDVQMPELDGLAVIGNLSPRERPLFIFVTAYSQYGLAAFDVNAVDYLLKPFDQARFEKAVEQAKLRIEEMDGTGRELNLSQLVDQIEAKTRYARFITIREGGRILPVKTEDIDWVQAERNYVRLHVGTRSFLRRESIGSLELHLDPRDFRRIHRSAIVNLNSIKELITAPSGDYEVVLRGGEHLVLRRTYKKNLPEFFI